MASAENPARSTVVAIHHLVVAKLRAAFGKIVVPALPV
jgi:hypothetical protein